MKTVRLNAAGTAIDSPIAAALLIAVTDSGKVGMISAKSSTFVLSLSPLADSAIWYFAADTSAGSPLDTLTFRYERQRQFISNACGYAYYFSLKNVLTTHNIIDSITITNASVTNNVNTSHLQVFIHPQP